MEFEITHITDYAYQYAAAEAYLEARLTPPDTPQQTVRSSRLVVEPSVKLSGYTDYYGNAVEFFSLPYRHRSLVITSRVSKSRRTQPEQPLAALEVSIDEARQILHSSQADVFDYLQPTEIVVSSRDLRAMGPAAICVAAVRSAKPCRNSIRRSTSSSPTPAVRRPTRLRCP